MQVFYVTNGIRMGHYHYAQNFLQGLSSEDLSVDVYYIEDDDEAEFPGARRHYPLATANRENRLFNIVLTLWYHLRLFGHLLLKRPDVVHFNTEFRNQYHTFGLTLAAKLSGATIVRTVHEITSERLGDVSELERSTAYRHLRACDHLIVHSEALIPKLRQEGVYTRTTVLPHGNYLSFRQYLSPNAKPPLSTDDKPVVLFFGPKRHKGIEVFAEAIAQTEAKFTTWIAGEIADDAEDVVSRIEVRPDVYVHREYIPDERIPDLFANADIVVLPYLSGTTSGALHLARAFRTTVITSDLPYFEMVVDHRKDGYILEENSPEYLAHALDELVSSPQLTGKIAEEGLNTERSSRFNWQRIAGEVSRIYSEAGDNS